jgi:CBS domain containing-hemolysin-like protein
MHETGRIPIPTEEVVIGSMRLTITKGTRSRIELVKLQLLD